MKKFLSLVVLTLLAAWPAAAQQWLLPATSHFTILDSGTGGFCYLTETPTFVGEQPTRIKIHGIGIGQASGFGNVRVDHLQTVSFDSGVGTISDATMVVTFTDGVVPPDIPDTLTLSYTGMAAPPNGFGQGTMSGTFTVTGGTGRFAGMIGRGVWSGSVALQAPYPVFWGAPDFKMLVFGDYGPQAVSVEPMATPMCAMQGRMVGFLINEGKNLK